jgi:hypothetical protein
MTYLLIQWFYIITPHIKKANFHYEAAAMAGDKVARCNLGIGEALKIG